eukprot:5562986-Pyramimonas_sp.AAC.1
MFSCAHLAEAKDKLDRVLALVRGRGRSLAAGAFAAGTLLRAVLAAGLRRGRRLHDALQILLL